MRFMRPFGHVQDDNRFAVRDQLLERRLDGWGDLGGDITAQLVHEGLRTIEPGDRSLL
jgi:hypothetical protein